MTISDKATYAPRARGRAASIRRPFYIIRLRAARAGESLSMWWVGALVQHYAPRARGRAKYARFGLHEPKSVLAPGVPLLGGEPIPLHGFGQVLRYALAGHRQLTNRPPHGILVEPQAARRAGAVERDREPCAPPSAAKVGDGPRPCRPSPARHRQSPSLTRKYSRIKRSMRVEPSASAISPLPLRKVSFGGLDVVFELKAADAFDVGRFRLTASKCDAEEGERGGPASVPHHV